MGKISTRESEAWRLGISTIIALSLGREIGSKFQWKEDWGLRNTNRRRGRERIRRGEEGEGGREEEEIKALISV